MMENRPEYLENLNTKKVGLVVPPSPFLLDERVFVSLGILRVAASLESQGVHVGVLDLAGVSNYAQALTSYLDNHSDLAWIGITTTTPQLPAAVELSKIIRAHSPNLKIVLGGPHVTLTYSAVKIEVKRLVVGRAHKAARLLESYFDVLVSGDGELAVFEAFNPSCAKVVDGDDMKGKFFMSDEVYEASEWPARHLVDLQSYNYSIEGFRATSLIGQLGCPFNCGFCGGRNSRSLRVIRTRSEFSIVNEVRWLYENYGFTGFMFYDDELNVSRTFVKLLDELYDLQQELGVEFRFRGFVKAELFTEAQAKAMHRAGFRWVLSGFEAAHPRILTNIDKMAKLEDNARVVALAHAHGLKVKALMSVGHPGEDEESILAIRDWLIKMKVDDFDCTVITTYPGTPYYDLAVPDPDKPGVWTYTHRKTGDKLHAYELDHTITADYYKGDPNGGYTAYVFSDFLSAADIVRLRDTVEADVRAALNIPFNPGNVAIKFEHSMGQGLPQAIYNESKLLNTQAAA